MEYQNNFSYNPQYEGVRRNMTPSGIGISRSENISPLVEQFLTFNRSFDKHNLTALAGWSAQSFTYESSGGTGQNLPVGVISLQEAQDNRVLSYNKQESSLRSLFGRVTYSYDDKYLFTANIRRDESSKLFRAAQPTGIFPSASVGWRISEEKFIQNIPFISDLKLRAGYGELGNQSVLGNYPVDVLFQPGYFYVLGNQVVGGITQGELANRNITWEVVKQVDIGIDAGLFNNRLTINFDYYNRKTEGVLWRRILSPSNGLGAPFVNGGEIENKGIELGITYRKNEGDFRYDLNGNITTINNRVLSLVNPDLIIRQGGPTDDISNVSWSQVGQPIGMFYGYVNDGIFRNWDEVYSHAFINQATSGTDADGNVVYDTDKRDAETATTKTAPGDLKWRDVNGDGVVNAEDQVALGTPIPDFTYGFTFNAAYRGFDFQFFLQGAHGHQIYNAAKRWLVDFRQNFNNGTEALNSTYYQPEYTASEARLVRADPNRNVLRSSDRYVFDGSYARIKNITLGYTFNTNVLNRLGASNIRVYGTVHNLATITNYFGLEPDIGSLSSTALQAGIDRLTYPQPRTFLVGVQVGF
jgi:TonB-linked SusC/RagA family outer membrane protein